MNRPLPTKPLFPAVLLLEGRRCLVVGGGRVALRKAAKLVAAGADVTVVAPAIDPALRALPGVALRDGRFEESDLRDVFLAFAATDDPAVNRRVVELCRNRGILCSAADAHWPTGDLILPASFTEDGLTVSISTSGKSCRRSRLLRERLSRHVRLLGDTELRLVGLDHRGNDVQALEALKAARAETERLMSSLWGVHEFMVLDTCNRFEVVAVASGSAVAVLTDLLRRVAGPRAPLQEAAGLDAFQRLAEIAAGLRAQAVGETRIVAQLKDALAEARAKGSAGSGLQGWTDLALHLSKAIRNAVAPHLAGVETEELVAQFLRSQGREDAPMLIVGRGEIGQGLARRFPSAAQVSGRSGAELAERLAEADVVVCATGSDAYVLEETHRRWLRPGAILIDLAVPRNISPELPGVVGLNELRATVPPATAKALADIVRTILEEHDAEYWKLTGSPQGLQGAQG